MELVLVTGQRALVPHHHGGSSCAHRRSLRAAALTLGREQLALGVFQYEFDSWAALVAAEWTMGHGVFVPCG